MVTIVTLCANYLSVNFIAAIQTINIVVTQNASEALNGGFAITFMDHTTPVLPYDATTEEVKSNLVIILKCENVTDRRSLTAINS